MKEKRKQPRTEIDIVVNYSKDAKAQSKNISESGICILSKESFSEGSYLNISFSLFENEEIQAYGKVKWSRKIDDSFYENHIVFWNIGELDKKKIKIFIKETQDNRVQA